MPEATQRRVHPDDLNQALALVDTAGRLITSVAISNNLAVQNACNSLVEDMVAFAKELIKTPVPVEPEPEAITA